jgi:hypothetical protein
MPLPKPRQVSDRQAKSAGHLHDSVSLNNREAQGECLLRVEGLGSVSALPAFEDFGRLLQQDPNINDRNVTM